MLLEEADVRAMVRLLGETAALQGDLPQKRRHLMAGLCRFVEADAWVWGQAAEMHPERLPVYIGFTHGGFSEETFARFLKIQTHPDMARLTSHVCRELQARQHHLTRTLAQAVPLADFEQAEVNRQWRECGLYPFVLSFYPLPDGIISVMALYRQYQRPPCTEREARIAHILMSEVPWLHTHQSSEGLLGKLPKMSVRQRLVLELLLQGSSRKAIADHLDISINTVAGYVRDIYRFLGVSSQAELLQRFFLGNGGDQVDIS